MDGVQLPQRYRATMRRQFTFTNNPGNHMTSLKRMKG